MDAGAPERDIPRQREIIDRRALTVALAEIAADLSPEAARPRLLETLKVALAQGRAEIRRRFETGEGLRDGGIGTFAVRSTSFLVDQLVRLVHDYADQYVYPSANPTAAERLTIIAVGGYGRAELCPHSDIDLLFLLPYKQTPRGEQTVEFILYLLWDLGLKVGHATRSLPECLRLAREDMTIRTALLESRYLWGDDKLYAELRKRFLAEVVRGTSAEFIAAKLDERNERHKRLGDSRYVLEPNVKEGKGGLRDLHTLFWIAKYVHRVEQVSDLIVKGVLTSDEAAKFAKAQDFLLQVRAHLHYLANRPEERLTFDVQSEIGRRLGYTDHRGTLGVERFMKHYFLVAKDVGDLTRIFCAALEIETEMKPRFSFKTLQIGPFSRRKSATIDGFAVESGRLTVAKASAFTDDPVNFLRIFRTAQVNGFDIHPYALRLIRQNLRLVDATLRADPEANRLFLEMLTDRRDAEVTLRRLSEAGVFGRFIPDFGRVVAQMQHDMYHVYTVDEHTIFCIGILHRIEAGTLKDEHPLASEIIHKIQSRRALYFALLLHDIAKGRGGDHSILGADVAIKLGPRVGLTEEETETVSWLVRQHLAMSNTAFKRDVHDPQTIRDFVALVQSPERLRLLLCLTVADIRGVGPNVWNNWKAALLRELYYLAEEALAGASGEGVKTRVAEAQRAVRAELVEWTDGEFTEHVARGYADYWLAFDTATLARHARIVRESERASMPLTVDTRIDRARGVTEVTIYTHDHPGLFSRLCGAMAMAGANIVGAQIFTMSNGMALDTFHLQDAAAIVEGGSRGAFDRPERIARLASHIEQALGGRIRVREQLARRPAIASRTRVFRVPPRVLIDNTASANHTLIEVNGRDRPGLLYEVTGALTALGLSIATAKIATYGERVVDVFYVKDVFGHKIDQESKQKRIRERLLAILGEPDDKGAGADAAPVRRRRAVESVSA